MMKNFLRVFIISLCLVVSQAPTTSLAQSNGETEIHDSSVDLVFSARSIDRYIGHLTLFAAGLVGIYQVRRCTSPAISCGWSTGISALAGIALLAGEIANMVTHKNVLKNLEYNKAELDENREECLIGSAGEEKVNTETDKKVCSQFGALIAQREAYESIREGLYIQQALRGAAGGAYLLASGMEVVAHIRKTASDSMMIASAGAAQASCPAFAAGPQAAACGESVARCEAALAGFQSFMTGKIAKFNNPAPTPSMVSCSVLRGEHLAALNSVQIGCAGCCAGNVGPLLAQLNVETQMLNCMANFTACDLGCQPPIQGIIVEDTTPNLPPKSWVQNFINNVFASALAQGEVSDNSIAQQVGSVLSFLSPFGVAALTGLISTKKYAGDNLFSTPVKRAAWYGALGLIVSVSSLHTTEALNEVNGYISDLNNLITAGTHELDSHNPSPSSSLSATQTVAVDFEDYADIQYPEYQAMAKALCPKGGDGKGKCLAVPDQVFSDLRELNLNDVAGVVSNLEDMGNEILHPKGSIKNALKLANKIAGQKSLVKKFNDEARKMLKENQEQDGTGPIDIDAEIQKAAMYGMQNTKNYLKEKKADLNKMFKHDIQEEENDSKDKKVEASPLAKKSPIKIDSDLASELSQPTIRFNLGSSDSKESESEVREEKDQDFSNVKAVHKREEGLFEAITRRYKESGFAKLLEEL